MFASYILRVRPEWLRDSQFTAELEGVGTGQRTLVHSMAEAREFVLSSIFVELATTRSGWAGERA